jgi:hypothetical protein
MRILSTVLISYVSWVLANSMTESSSCFWKCNRISGQILYNGLLKLWTDCYIHICTHHWELMMGGHGSSSLLFMTTVMVWNFVSNSQGYISTHCCVTFNVLLWRFLCNPHGYDGMTGSEFRGPKSGHWWNVGFTFVRGAALPVNTPGVPCIFDAHARVGICGDWLLGSSLEAAALSGMALAHHVSTL